MTTTVQSNINQIQPIPKGIKKHLPNPQSPWELSPSLLADVRNGTLDSSKAFRTCEVLPKHPEYDFIHKYFNHTKPINTKIQKIECIYNEDLLDLFVKNLVPMSNETKKFPPQWQKELDQLRRQEVIDRFNTQKNEFQPLQIQRTDRSPETLSKDMAVLPLLHGTKEPIANSIAETGFTFFGKHGGDISGSTDPGFFGSGIYFTDSFRYASMYSPKTVLMSWVSMRTPHPVTSDKKDYDDEPSEMLKLKSMGAYKDTNAHFIPVSSVNPSSLFCLIYYPTTKDDPNPSPWNEYVIFQKSQACPSFKISLESNIDFNTGNVSVPSYSFNECYQVIHSGNLNYMKHWASEDPNRLLERTKAGKTYLHIATELGQTEIVEYLLKETKLLNLSDNRGWNAFHFAAANGEVEIGKLLMEKKPKFAEIPTTNGDYPLHLAAKWGNYEFVRYVYEKYPDAILKANTIKGWTALHSAVFSGNTKVIDFIYKKNKKLWDVRGNLGENIFHLAAEYGKVDATKWLLKEQGWSIFSGKLSHEKNGKKLDKDTPLITAIRNRQFEVAYLLLDKKTARIPDAEGNYPLYIGIKAQSLKFVQKLLEMGADPNQINYLNRTPLHAAAHHNVPNIAKYLLEKKADVNAVTKDADGRMTSLHIAAEKGASDLAEVILKADKIVPNLKDKNGLTPLYYAVRTGADKIVKLILTHKNYMAIIDENDPCSIKKLKTLNPPQNAQAIEDLLNKYS